MWSYWNPHVTRAGSVGYCAHAFDGRWELPVVSLERTASPFTLPPCLDRLISYVFCLTYFDCIKPRVFYVCHVKLNCLSIFFLYQRHCEIYLLVMHFLYFLWIIYFLFVVVLKDILLIYTYVIRETMVWPKCHTTTDHNVFIIFIIWMMFYSVINSISLIRLPPALRFPEFGEPCRCSLGNVIYTDSMRVPTPCRNGVRSVGFSPSENRLM